MAWVDLEAPVVRWLFYLSATALVGVATAAWVIAADESSLAAHRSRIERRLLFWRQTSAVILAIAIVLLIVAQVRSWFGPGAERDAAQYALVLRSRWGGGWLSTAVAGLVALAIALWPARGRALAVGSRWSALAASVAVPLTGHGATSGPVIWTLHVLHVLGGGLWLGALAALLTSAWPIWRDGPAPAFRALLGRFSVMALTGAGALVASGTMLSLTHVSPIAAFRTTPYGQTVLAKMVMTFGIAALGWRNWRRLGPRVDQPAIRRTLGRAAIVEVVIGIVAIGAAAWLSTLSPPGE